MIISIHLSEQEALVLHAWLADFNASVDPSSFSDQAEQRVLWNLEASLEAAVPTLFAPDYSQLLNEAMAQIRDACD